jgi:hypothetical protein
MRKKFGVGFGLIAVVLAIAGPPFVALSMRPYEPLYEPPLRVGMNEDEVNFLLGACNCPSSYMLSTEFDHPGLPRFYGPNPDWAGNQQHIGVWFDNEHRVTAWEIQCLPRTYPPWLDAVMEWVGW